MHSKHDYHFKSATKIARICTCIKHNTTHRKCYFYVSEGSKTLYIIYYIYLQEVYSCGVKILLIFLEF